MTDIPGLRDEPFIINEDFYRDRLETKITAYNFSTQRINRVVNWLQVIQFLMENEDFGVQLKKDIPCTAGKYDIHRHVADVAQTQSSRNGLCRSKTFFDGVAQDYTQKVVLKRTAAPVAEKKAF